MSYHFLERKDPRVDVLFQGLDNMEPVSYTHLPVRYVRDDTRGQRDRQGVGSADHP